MQSLSWRLTLRVIAVLSWIVAIAWLIVDPGFEPLLAFLAGAAALLGSFAAREDGLTPEQRQRNRRAIHDSRGWCAHKWRTFLGKMKAMLASFKTRFEDFRACLRGELAQSRLELKAERDRCREEGNKVRTLSARLLLLSKLILYLCDKECEHPEELKWDETLEIANRAVRCARGALCHHVTKVVYYDPTYPASSWMDGENAEKTRDYFVERWFVEKNAQQLQDWICRVLDGGEAYRSLIVFAQDIVPETVAEVPNETCLLRKYLNDGGRVVWRGDIPFWYQGKAGGAVEQWFKDGPQGVLGVLYHNYLLRGGGRIWDSDLPSRITNMGEEIGLTYSGKCTRPVECQDVDTAYVLVPQKHITTVDVPKFGRGQGDFALCWKKNFCKRYSHSGFMQYVLGKFLWRDTTTASFFSFAISGWPLLFE